MQSGQSRCVSASCRSFSWPRPNDVLEDHALDMWQSRCTAPVQKQHCLCTQTASSYLWPKPASKAQLQAAAGMQPPTHEPLDCLGHGCANHDAARGPLLAAHSRQDGLDLHRGWKGGSGTGGMTGRGCSLQQMLGLAAHRRQGGLHLRCTAARGRRSQSFRLPTASAVLIAHRTTAQSNGRLCRQPRLPVAAVRRLPRAALQFRTAGPHPHVMVKPHRRFCAKPAPLHQNRTSGPKPRSNIVSASSSTTTSTSP